MPWSDPHTILVVDDERSLRFFLQEELEGYGYQVYTASGGREALALLETVTADVAIIDLKMAGLNGLELMTAMKKLDDVPEFIMLTAHATLETSISAMRCGTVDFLLKPYKVEELLSALQRALQRRRQTLKQRAAAKLLAESLGSTVPQSAGGAQHPPERSAVESPDTARRRAAGGLLVDLEAMTAFKDGRPLALTPTEFRLLTILIRKPNHPYTFQALARSLHDQEVDPLRARDLLKSHIARLRRKLGQDANGQSYLVNVRGVGYKLVVGDTRCATDVF